MYSNKSYHVRYWKNGNWHSEKPVPASSKEDAFAKMESLSRELTVDVVRVIEVSRFGARRVIGERINHTPSLEGKPQ